MDETEHDGAHSDVHGVTPGVVYGEVQDFIRSHELRRHQLPRAVGVGLFVGLLAVAFRWTLTWGDGLRDRLITYAHHFPAWGFLLPVAFGAAGGGIGVYLVQRYAPEASGSGIPHLKAVLHHLRGMKSARILVVKFVAGIAAIGGGMALGREGPTVQMGGAVGDIVSRWWDLSPRERQTLIAAGAGAGLAAAFNAPLAGLVFVLEELQRDFTPGVFTAAFVASVTADVVTRLLTSQLPVYHAPAYPVPPLVSLPAFLLLGVVSALVGVAFNRGLVGTLNLFQKTGCWPCGINGVLVGGAVGLIGWFMPQAVGGGQALIERSFYGAFPLSVLAGYLVLRYFMTLFSYGSGAPGGIFAPLLVLGAETGLGFGGLVQKLYPRMAGHPGAYMVVGMAACFTAIVRAPLTGIVLMVEMTGSYSLMLPLLVACLVAYGLADFLGDLPIYEALLERDLLRGQENPELESTLLLEMTVYPGSEFEGKKVRELGLPSGCVLVTLRRGGKEEVPTADTELLGGDRITAVVAPQAAEAVQMLKEGTEG